MLAGGLTLPLPVRAGAGGPRRFLFVFANGGWDTTAAFVPAFDLAGVDTEAGGAAATAGGITFVDHGDRPSVRRFFERFGSRACLINGIEIPSVAHERCRRLLLTGGVSTGVDDWPGIIASGAPSLAMPHLVITGPSYSQDHAGLVVRVGRNGQLVDLAESAGVADVPVAAMSPDTVALEEAFLAGRLRGAPTDRLAGLRADYETALERRDALRTHSARLSLRANYSECSRDFGRDLESAINSFSLGLSRCAIVQDDGFCGISWDSHSDNTHQQSSSFEQLFSVLETTMDALGGRRDPYGRPLSESTVIVVFSEMGRTPTLSAWGGRDHWTTTSALLIGGGIAGGRTIGRVGDDFTGRAIDLASGEVSDHGVVLGPDHLGATLLALADIDPAEWTSASPLLAALSGS